MLRRKMYDVLKEWKSRKHKCLTVKGQRQTGKTFIIDRFGKAEYEHYLYIDLSKNEYAKEVFDGDLDVDQIIKGLRLVTGQDIPEGSLIFLDEIQECPRARTSLKSFTIDGRYDVIASGSLLGLDNVGMSEGRRELSSMGYEENVTMYSLDFEEFLWALGIPADIIDDVRICIHEKRPIQKVISDKFSAMFRDFMIVGGMPEAVEAFAETKDYSRSFDILDDILAVCRNDINRYNSGINIIRTLQCFDSIAPQLAETNKKFTYTRISGDEKRRSFDKYMENLLWIKYSGYGNFCYLLNSPTLPLTGSKIPDVFKVYLSDTGMLMRMYGRDTARAIFLNDTSYNNGAIAENAVAECLMKAGVEPLSYRKSNGDNKMELDFVTEMDSKIAVIEVKSGKKRGMPSLNKVCDVFDIGRRIMVGDENISVDGAGIEHYPLFAAAFVKDMTQNDGLPF